MFRSGNVILVTREGRPAGFFLPWGAPEPPDDVRREGFLRLTDQIVALREARGVPEDAIIADLAAARRRR